MILIGKTKMNHCPYNITEIKYDQRTEEDVDGTDAS